MGDILGLDPARIARLRDPARLKDLDPARVWEAVAPPADGETIVDIGSGVGYLTLPFARKLPGCRVVGADVLEGMVALLAEDARNEGLSNLEALSMAPARVPLPDASAALVIMAQVHHELDQPAALLAECARLLRPGGTLAIIDWKDEDNGKSPPKGRAVPEETVRAQMTAAGLRDVTAHPLYPYHYFLTALR
jgi:ubiquinone/menaquinone biosynthesis C-methylase UbiE